MKKLYSIFEIKGVNEADGKRTFTGIASTPTTDRMDDIVEPLGAEFKLPIPLLWQHDHRDPVGWITKAKPTKDGIYIEGEVADIPEDGKLKERLLEAWQMLKNKLVQGLSIGFIPLETSDIEGSRWGQRISKWEWIELSAVTIPANQEATITAIKAASGRTNRQPGATGRKSYGGITMKTLQEQLAELKEARADSAARMNEISESIKAKTVTSEDNAEFDELEAEVENMDNDIRVKQAEIANAKTATAPAPKAKTAPTVIIKNEDKEDAFEGQSYVRQVIAKAVARMDDVSAIGVAEKRWGKTNPTVVSLVKAAVEGGGATSGDWGAELVQADTRYTGDFIEFLHGQTVYDQLPLREVPANVAIKGQDGAATGFWVGDNAGIPVSAQDFSTVSLTPLKVAALAVISNELIRDSSPAAEMLVRDALVEASAKRVDETFISATAASAGVSPAGILNGISADSATGNDADALRADIKTLYGDFITAKTARGLVLVMNPALAKSIQMLYNALGNPEFPNITQDGGTLMGDPVVTGDNVAALNMVLLNPREIYKIGDSGVQVSISREATIEMTDAPTVNSEVPTAMGSHAVGMFQTESTAIKVVRSINFQRRRTAAQCVGYIDDALYDNSSF